MSQVTADRASPGAEPFSADGGPHGVLVLHGFTGNPQSMRGLAEAFAAAGFAVELPLLPGHGTTIDDMLGDRVGRLVGCRRGGLQRARRPLRARSWSPGCRWAARWRCGWRAAPPRDRRASSAINAADRARRRSVRASACSQLLDDGHDDHARGIGHDVADPDANELAYDGTPLAPLLSLFEAGDELHGRAGRHPLPGARHEQPAGPRRAAGRRATSWPSRVSRPGRAGHPRAQLPRRHPRLRQGPRSSARRRRLSRLRRSTLASTRRGPTL